jgi:cytochrome bd-type quinol oxidase subunit 2
MARPAERERWLDRSENVTKVYWSVWAICALLVAAQVFVHMHGHFAAEEWFGFHGWFGFVACVALVIAAKGLRVLLKRPEDYYDRP